MGSLLNFIDEHQAALRWLGGGFVFVAGGAWVVVKVLLKRSRRMTVSASDGSVAAGGDQRNNTITIMQRARRAHGQQR
jgi:hypothetical protein